MYTVSFDNLPQDSAEILTEKMGDNELRLCKLKQLLSGDSEGSSVMSATPKTDKNASDTGKKS
ncbi:hypothetical protein L9F63_019369, partial [Diploptera punctata]